MANSEQGSSLGGNKDKGLVFDEKKGKWRMVRVDKTGKITGYRLGHPISEDQASRMSDGLRQYWKRRQEAGEAPMPLQVADKVSTGLKRYHHEKRKQQQ